MAAEGVERRLAAIRSADVVSYSRLMADEKGATAFDRRTKRDAVRNALVLLMTNAIL